jgi:UDP-glucose 4-epimerase
MTKVLITGITGFLGSRIAETLINQDIAVIGLKQNTSDTWRCKEFIKKVYWIDIDEKTDYKKIFEGITIDVLIHCAWIGVKAYERDNLDLQQKNIHFLKNILEVVQIASIKKMIFLGSQSEYGVLNNIVNETQKCEVANAYGRVKLDSLWLVESFAKKNKISWIWLRVFSVFGEKEDSAWLIPSLIKRMKVDRQMDFTLGEQKYAYLYIGDFATIVYKILSKTINSGIYNISSNNAMPVRKVVEKIRDIINPTFKLNFGSLKYRENQSMHVEGDITKLIEEIGDINFTDFDTALNNTIKYYAEKY